VSEGLSITVNAAPEIMDSIRAILEAVESRQTEQTECWLDVDSAAAHLSCGRKRIYDLVSEGRLRCAKEGRRSLFRREWLDAVIELDGGENDLPEGLESDAIGQ
jgi:excisionase family DNA binding protein